MKALSNIIRAYGVSKTVGSSQPREFLFGNSSNRDIWFGKRRFSH